MGHKKKFCDMENLKVLNSFIQLFNLFLKKVKK